MTTLCLLFMRTLKLLILFFHLAGYTCAQERKIDSLNNLIAITNPDTSKIELYEKLGQVYVDEKKLDSSILCFKQSLAINERTGYSLQKQCWNTAAIDYLLYVTGDYLASLKYAVQHLALSEKLNDTFQKGFAHLVFGHDYKGFGYYRQSLNHYFKAKEFLKIYHLSQHNPEDNTYTILCIGDVYLKMNKLDSALFFARQAYQLAQVAVHSGYILYSLRLLGDIYLAQEDDKTAISFFYQYVPLFYTSNENNRDIGFVYNNMARIFQKRGQIDSAIFYAKKAFTNAQQYSDQENLYHAATLLSNYYSERNEHEAFNYFKVASYAKDSMINIDKLRQAQLLLFNEQTREKEIQEANAREAARIKRAIIISAIVVSLISFLIWNRMRQLKLRYKMFLEQKEIEKLKVKYEKELLELEAKALRAQMNPHFIFNSMNSIKALIQQEENEKAITYLTTFSKLIRTIFNNSDKRQVTLFDELETCNLYLQLEAKRFADKLQYAFVVDKEIDLKSIDIPALTLQPFIENAVWHGIMPKDEGGNVTVAVRREGDTIVCVIDDNGIGRNVSLQNKAPDSLHQSKGVYLTQSRLKLENFLNDRKGVIDIVDKTDNEGRATGTLVQITLQAFI